ncbi:Gamma-glutamylputrescine oxidoreductase [Pseudoruegeria aquimaris]|uniref:Gamma-glutamylputrescine oxidoreductase n=1 Tax=Pseudoruegeria aquimaris TaxID=393663 RepID=A0A1Y5T1Y6_9RHOB|nr:FAD-binding oxidoreductase [Pseudoruegeria aquimaris]SLN53579.1 Gamma-glutamylputrescine oxidoreductase [Pseudoruegeria aquimaris]
MRVRHLPVDPGPAGWNRLLPEPPPPEPLEHRITADWLVIGAGFAGLAAAHRLAEKAPGDRIVLLDAVRVGDGPAGRNSGFMVDLPHDLTSEDYGGTLQADLAQTEDNRRGIAQAQKMAEQFGLPEEAFSRSGKINGAASQRGQAHNESFAHHLAAMGEPHEHLDAAQMREITGTSYYTGGLFTPGSAMIQPAMFVRGVAQGLRSNRVRLHEASPVVQLKRLGDWIATTPHGEVCAPRVILAVNGHLESFGRMRGRLMHVFTYASMTRALSPEECARLGGQAVWGLTPSDPMGSTVRRISGTGGDRIIVRNRFTFEPSMKASPARLKQVYQTHDRAFAARFPMLDGVSMEYRWGGRLCLSRNNVQVIGALDEGLFSACCQNGLGTAKGTLAGGLAADLALGIGSPALDRALASAPPSRLPPAPIARLGATLHLRHAERRAGREL